MALKTITQAEYDAIPKDYKGIYSDFQGVFPELKGKRTMLDYDEQRGTVLLIEGSSFKIEG